MNDSALITDPHAGVLGVGYSTSPELLRQCIASGQVEASAIVAHALEAPPRPAPTRAPSTEGHNPILQLAGDRCQCERCEADREATSGALASSTGLTLDANHTRFLAARLRRLFEHFGIPVPGADDDARLIGNAAAGIGLLLTAQPGGVDSVDGRKAG